MPARKVGLPNVVPKDLADGLAAIRAAMERTRGFRRPVLAAAEQAAARPAFLILIAPTRVDHHRSGRLA